MKIVRSTDLLTWAMLSSLLAHHATGTFWIAQIALTVVLLTLALWEFRNEQRERGAVVRIEQRGES